MTNPRKAEYDIAPIFVNRWSPRSFEPVNIEESELFRMFEAAKWSPSALNFQPWRFFYALRSDEMFAKYLSCLGGFNQGWAKNASALVFLISKTDGPDGRANINHEFDTGAAWLAFSLQGREQGLVTHAMSGINHAAVAKLLKLPENYKVHAAIAVGKQGAIENLSASLQEREHPNPRNFVKDFAVKGTFENFAK